MSTPFEMLTREDIRRFIDDYIVLMMLLGNDFMPKCYWMSIKAGGHAQLLRAYMTVINGVLAGEDKWLYDRLGGGFNMPVLQAIFRILAEKEDELARTFFDDRATRAKIRISEQATERERQIQLMEFMPLQYLNIEAEIRAGMPGWRERYYRVCMRVNPGNPANITNICEAYWRTLCWNAGYYLNDCPSWDWFYPYDYAPTMADMCAYLGNLKKSTTGVSFGQSAPITPQTLLLMVLPEKSSGLMARAVEQGIKSNPVLMGLYFPRSYELNIACHTRYHECSPQIPRINLRLCQNFIKKCKLSPSEEARNTVGGIKYYINGRLNN
jgi:5'-3' exoribonuclease 2